jgi:hypothetical protein
LIANTNNEHQQQASEKICKITQACEIFKYEYTRRLPLTRQKSGNEKYFRSLLKRVNFTRVKLNFSQQNETFKFSK